MSVRNNRAEVGFHSGMFGAAGGREASIGLSGDNATGFGVIGSVGDGAAAVGTGVDATGGVSCTTGSGVGEVVAMLGAGVGAAGITGTDGDAACIGGCGFVVVCGGEGTATVGGTKGATAFGETVTDSGDGVGTLGDCFVSAGTLVVGGSGGVVASAVMLASRGLPTLAIVSLLGFTDVEDDRSPK